LSLGADGSELQVRTSWTFHVRGGGSSHVHDQRARCECLAADRNGRSGRVFRAVFVMLGRSVMTRDASRFPGDEAEA